FCVIVSSLFFVFLCTYFFFSSSRAHRYLHSFPTRRSSDLAVLTLLIIRFTEWIILDSIVAVLVACYIIFEGIKLLHYSIDGLMDSRDPEVDKMIRSDLSQELPGSMLSVHNLRHRTAGHTTWIELHAVYT